MEFIISYRDPLGGPRARTVPYQLNFSLLSGTVGAWGCSLPGGSLLTRQNLAMRLPQGQFFSFSSSAQHLLPPGMGKLSPSNQVAITKAQRNNSSSRLNSQQALCSCQKVTRTFPPFAYSHFPLPGTSETQFLNVSLCFMPCAEMVPHLSLGASLDYLSSAFSPGSDTCCGIKADLCRIPERCLGSQQTVQVLYFLA